MANAMTLGNDTLITLTDYGSVDLDHFTGTLTAGDFLFVV